MYYQAFKEIILICVVGIIWDITMVITSYVFGNPLLCIMPACGILFWVLFMICLTFNYIDFIRRTGQ